MALIKCSKCGKEISDKATSCIHCGEKIIINTGKRKSTTKSNNKSLFIIIGLIVAILIIAIIIYFALNLNKENYIGKWEHNIIWQENGIQVRKSYSSIELKKDGTFNYVGYDIDNTNDKLVYNGTYNKNNDNIYIYFNYNGQEYTSKLYIKNDKMCVDIVNCQDYYIKDSSQSKNTITINEENKYISYNEYQSIISNKKDAIIIFTKETCGYCNNYKDALNQVKNSYSIPIYYYDIEKNDNINITTTPTTMIVKNGIVADKFEGFTETTLNTLQTKLSQLGF